MNSPQNNTPDFSLLGQAIEKLPFEFSVDDCNKEIFEQLKMYFTGNLEFEKNGMSLRKGVLLQGRVGSGKTIMMQLFRQYGKYSMNRPRS